MRKVGQIASLYSELQLDICDILEKTDGKASFEENLWENEIGSGMTCVIRNGNAIEKGGVNYSFVSGNVTAQMEKILGEKADRYSATGISSIMHPVNPHVPVIHMNIRYFELDSGIGWYGGGIDLTPHYVDVSEAKTFHHQLKSICDKYDELFYPHFKKWADDYFFLPHRHETRGVGGIFFDRLVPDERINFKQLLSFTLDLGKAYPEIYSEIVNKKSDWAYSESEKKWQQIRRGRYVEFNLIHDRGTKFGLESGGNTESILISLPSDASWEYNYETQVGSAEERTLQLLKKEIDWVNFEIE
jgi:coproporphyrinogen III oxidase